MATKLLTVFKDITCSELKADVTNEEINKLPSKYFVHIAEALKNNDYDEWEKEFRIRKYNAYSDINECLRDLGQFIHDGVYLRLYRLFQVAVDFFTLVFPGSWSLPTAMW